MKRSAQFTGAARVVLHELGGVEAGVRHIAAPAAGDADLLQEMRAFLEDRHPAAGCHFRKLQRGEKPGRAPADDSEIKRGDGAGGHAC